MSIFLKKRIQPLVNDIEQMIEDTGSEEMSRLMQAPLERFHKNVSQPLSGIRIVVYGQPNEIEQQQLQTFFNPLLSKLPNPAFSNPISWSGSIVLEEKTKPIPILLQSWDKVNFYETEQKTYPCLLAWICQNGQGIVGLSQHLQMLLTEVAFLRIYFSGEKTLMKKLKNQLEGKTGILEIQSWDKMKTESLNNVMDSFQKLPLSTTLTNYLAFQKVLDLLSILNQKLEHLNFSLQNKKQRIEQEISQNQALSKKMAGSSFSSFKNIISQRTQQFERRFVQEMEEALSPPLGNIPKTATENIETLEDLSQTKDSKNLLYHIPEDFSESIFDYLRNACKNYCQKELKEAAQCLSILTSETKSFLQSHQLPFLSKGHSLIGQQEIDALLERKIRIDRKFEGKAANKTMMQYFMGARMYFMMFIMVMSMLGIGSYLADYPFIMLPLAVLLVSLGIYQMWSSKQKEDAENHKKYLEEAQTHLKNGTQRIAQDVARSWEKMLLDGVKANTQKLLQEAEQVVQSTDNQLKTKQESEKRRLKFILDSISSQERSLSSIKNAQSRMKRELTRVEEDLQKELKGRATSPPPSKLSTPPPPPRRAPLPPPPKRNYIKK